MKFITQAAKVLQEQKKSKRRLAVFLCLAALVALGTVTALRMYGQAMSHKEKRLICQAEAHQHTDDCYDGDKLVCGQADYLVHTHNDDCYGADGSLVCHLAEIAVHTHTDECYTEEEVLVCTEEEQAHQHTDDCYTPERGDLQCQTEEHAHDEGCFDSETGELVCQLEEHQHDDNCYVWNEVLTCTAGGHQHSADCYIKEQGGLQCQIEEHIHDDACYDENGALICQMEEHTHEDTCYAWEDVLICQLEEGPAGHIHTDACYEKRKVPTCGQLELHTHGGSCYDENGELICELLELKEHTHQEECFETVELTDEEVAVKLEQQEMEEAFQEEDPENAPEDGTDSTSDDGAGTVSGDSVSNDEAGSVSGDSVSGDDVSGNSVSGDSVSGDSMSENDVHVHDESCYDAAGGLMCEYEDVKEPEIIKTYKDEDGAYIVTAKYTKKANIPEKAELRAELITAESAEEHYAEREAEIRRALEDDSVSMNALFKIGFYVDEEEVEPENEVVVTVQFLDENGMKDGSPIAVVHFAEEGSEVINGGKAKDKSTTFKTRRFSEFGIVEGYEVQEEGLREKKDKEKQYEDKVIEVSESCEYNNSMFQATFHIQGEVKLPADLVKMIEEGKSEDHKEPTEVSENTTAVEKDMDTSGNRSDEDGEVISADTTDEEAEDADKGSEDPGEDSSEIETIGSEEESTEGEAAGPEGEVEDNEVSVDEESSDSSEKLEFRVEPINEDVEEYAEDYSTVMAYMDEIGMMDDQLIHQVMAYTLTCNNVKLNLSDCKVTAEIRPSRSLKKTAQDTEEETSDDGEEESEVTLSVIQAVTDPEKTDSEDETMEDGSSADVSEKIGKVIAAAPVKELDAPMMVEFVTEDTSGIAAFSANSQANPRFTVEYYAYIDKLATSAADITPLPVIDTSGKKMPQNGETNPSKGIYVEQDGTVKMDRTLKEVYSAGKYNYVEAPGLTYFNKIAKNKNYKLIKIQVKKEGEMNWTDHLLEENKEWHFTNKPDTASKYPDEFILITANATVRLVYEVDEKIVNAGTEFYDYDISDGKIYVKDSNNNLVVTSRGQDTTHDSGTKWYMYTNREGINNNVETQTFGFGNANMNTTMESIEGNVANVNNEKCGYATFGLVTGLNNNKIQYKDGVVAPNLFDDSTANGKTAYTGDLIFSQKGDTYTLTGASVNDGKEIGKSGVSDLDKFNRQQWNNRETYYFAANDFYPMDDVHSAGSDGHDLKFGSPGSSGYSKGAIHTASTKTDPGPYGVPVSDDGQNHNHYFGMHYTVDFSLVEDYVGPLEYLFYGDDDMWVFLSGKGHKKGDTTDTRYDYSGQLICDIGGVHSSIGEYVNLRDYLPNGTEGDYTLTFFYTERGASGSTCWMQFTLPSVKFATPVQETGELKIQKQVTGDETNTDQEFGFEIQFTDENGDRLRDDYSYTKYSIDNPGKPISTDVLIWDNAKFTLKANEYILVNFLPDGSNYTITEIGPVFIKNPERDPGEDLKWDVAPDNPYIPDITGPEGTTGTKGVITGTISKETQVEIAYNNIKKFELPETGGAGANIYLMVGAFFIMAGTVLVYRKRIVARRS